MKTHKELMDSIYKHQRHFYDLSRKIFLLGRDKMLKSIDIKGNEKVLEIGCGTARNLIKLAKKYPSISLYGVDASKEMLKTARKKTDIYKIRLFYSLAEDFNYNKNFKFNVIFFSYSLSMMPKWKKILENALRNLKKDGTLCIVDFWDQRGMPSWLRCVIKKWLSLFHVKFEPKLLEYLKKLKSNRKINLKIIPVFKRYSYIAIIKKLGP